jgi:predicted methyltransferase
VFQGGIVSPERPRIGPCSKSGCEAVKALEDAPMSSLDSNTKTRSAGVLRRARQMRSAQAVLAAKWARAGSVLLVLAAIGCRTKTSAELGTQGAAVAGKTSQTEWARRDAWQRPTEVMDALGIQPGSVVADVGAGEGYFTFHLAARVGPLGRVFAEDISEEPLRKLRERAREEGLSQVEPTLGTATDPKLPPGALDAILIVNAYHEMGSYDSMLTAMFRALKPGGLLAIIDPEGKPNLPRSSYFKDHKMTKELVLEDAARSKLHFLREEKGFDAEPENHWFFLLFEKPQDGAHRVRSESASHP